MNIALKLTLIYLAISFSLQVAIFIWAKFHGRWLLKKLGERMTDMYGELVEYRIPVQLTPEEQEELEALDDESGDNPLNRILSLLWAVVHLPGLIFVRIPDEGGIDQSIPRYVWSVCRLHWVNLGCLWNNSLTFPLSIVAQLLIQVDSIEYLYENGFSEWIVVSQIIRANPCY